MKLMSQLTLFVTALGFSCGMFAMNAPEYSGGFKNAFGPSSFASAGILHKILEQKTAPIMVKETVPAVVEATKEVVKKTATEIVPGIGSRFVNYISPIFKSIGQFFKPYINVGIQYSSEFVSAHPKLTILGVGGVCAILAYKYLLKSADTKQLIKETKNKQAKDEQPAKKKNEKNIVGDAAKVEAALANNEKKVGNWIAREKYTSLWNWYQVTEADVKAYVAKNAK